MTRYLVWLINGYSNPGETLVGREKRHQPTFFVADTHDEAARQYMLKEGLAEMEKQGPREREYVCGVVDSSGDNLIVHLVRVNVTIGSEAVVDRPNVCKPEGTP